MKNKILFVGGTWNNEGGKPSKIVELFSKELKNIDLYNGGNYKDLNKILESAINYDIVLWWPNIPNDLPKLKKVKEINYKIMLVSSKRNNNEYSFQELLQRSFESKSNLIIEFTKEENIYKMRLFDPLGNVWYYGTNIKECSKELTTRLEFIKSIKRESTISDEENKGALAWFFNDFKEEMYNSNIKVKTPINEEFISIIKEYAIKLAMNTFQTTDVKKFLGNASLRCPKGFPSFRDKKYIFVSKRNINKEFITINDFVPVYEKDNKIYYCGDYKPSVDSPIQVKLYKYLKNINYMIHSHCYLKDAPYTKTPLPCGAIDEVNEIISAIKENYKSLNKHFYKINLIGHGSIIMSNKLEKLKDIEIISRNLPEYIKR